MIDAAREEMLRQLQQSSDLAPEMRFGQLAVSMAFLAAGPWDETLWDLEDEQLLAALRRHVAALTERRAAVPAS
jgi:hypothetical protein